MFFLQILLSHRFVVVCSYQSGMQTVRASFSVPGKGGASAVSHHESIEEEERMGRGLKPFRFVDKSELILKENDPEALLSTQSSEEIEAVVEEMQNPTVPSSTSNHSEPTQSGDNSDEDVSNSVAILENIIPGVNEDHIKRDDETSTLKDDNGSESSNNGSGESQYEESEEGTATDEDKSDNEKFSAKFAKLILERNDRDHYVDDLGDGAKLSDTPTGRGMYETECICSTFDF